MLVRCQGYLRDELPKLELKTTEQVVILESVQLPRKPLWEPLQRVPRLGWGNDSGQVSASVPVGKERRLLVTMRETETTPFRSTN